MEELKQQLMDTFPVNWFTLLFSFAEVPNQQAALPLLQAFRSSLTDSIRTEQRQAFVGLVEMACRAKTLDTESAKTLCQDLISPVETWNGEERCHTFYGFAYLEANNSWKYYGSSYRPNVVTRKTQLPQKGILSTPILVQGYQVSNSQSSKIHTLKEDFMVLLGRSSARFCKLLFSRITLQIYLRRVDNGKKSTIQQNFVSRH